jgi:hypothetical protein
MLKLGRVVLIVLSLVVVLPLAAQSAVIRGRVMLPDGAALPGVTVSAGDVTAVSDAEGRYEITVASRGIVRVSASLQGFQTRSVSVDTSQGDATQDITLHVSFGQEITVGSRAIGAEQEKAVPIDVIPQEQIASSPSTETSQIIQKIAPSFNFRGRRSPTVRTASVPRPSRSRPLISSWSCSTASVATPARWSTRTTPSAAARAASISTRFPRGDREHRDPPRRRGPRNTAPTRSRA